MDFGLHKWQDIFKPAEQISVSQEGLCLIEEVSYYQGQSPLYIAWTYTKFQGIEFYALETGSYIVNFYL
jgi:hypothetical protein